MDEASKERLRRLRIHISRSMNARMVVEGLYAEGILDFDDREEVLAETTTQHKVLKLLDVLPFKGPQAFNAFLKALRTFGYEFLANQIQSEFSGDATGNNERKPTSFGIPKKVPKFIGRADICENILSLLISCGDDATSLISLVAPPGFGKTAVAINMGYTMLEKGKDVLYVSLRSIHSVALAAKNMLGIIGIPEGDDPIRQVKKYLTSLQCDMLLILDNAEDLQVAEEKGINRFLEEIGQLARNVTTLITSRIPLKKLDFPFLAKHIALKPLDELESFNFLKYQGILDQQAQRFAKPKVCGGVPLLLKLTASFLKSKTIDAVELHRNLQNCPHSFLKIKDPKIQEFFLLLKVFYNHLQPEVKRALASLAAFPTVFTREEAKNVLFCNKDYLEFQILLNTLESHSLVQREGDNNCLQYSLHPLVQAFCKACDENECKGYKTAIRIFSWHYLSLLRQLHVNFITTNCKPVIDKYHVNKVNICHALAVSTDDEFLKQYGVCVSTETVNFLAKVMNMDEFMTSYNGFVKVARSLPDKTLYSECLISIGFKQLCYHGYMAACRTDAMKNLQEAHDLQNHLGKGDTECLGHCKCKLGLCTFILGDKRRGISLIAQGIGVRKRLEHCTNAGKMERMLVAGGFSDLAMAMFTSGQYQAAVNIWKNICLVRYDDLLGTHPFTASLLDYMGEAYGKLGYLREAVVFKEKSLTMRRFLLGDEHLDTARAYYGLGRALGALGSTDDALESLNKARSIQVRVLASQHDIDKTEKEINSLRGRERAESPCRMLQQMQIENRGAFCRDMPSPLTT